MKLKQIALAVALATVVGSAFAAPVTPANITAARSANTLDTTWISGASAQAQVVYFGMRDTCDLNTVSIFTNDAANTVAGSLGNFVAYACKVGTRTKVVYHTMDGGSFNAFAPHTNGTKIDRLKELSSNASCVLNATTYVSGGYTASVYNACAKVGAANAVTEANAPHLPAGGFSDVESNMFLSQLSLPVNSVGTEAPVGLTQGFGVVVNTKLYRELQVAQGIYASTAAAAADSTFDPVNAPNITSAQYASIISGTYSTDWTPILGAAGANHAIYLARRIDTSGTQASSNAFFLKTQCNGDAIVGGSVAPVAATIAGNVGATVFQGASDTSGEIVFEGSGTTDVKQALTNADASSKFAIGVISLENNSRAETKADRKEYHFVKLDSVHPEAGDPTFARSTLVSAAYPFAMETTYFVANTADAYGAALLPAIVGKISTSTNCSTDPTSRGLALTVGSPSSCTAQITKGTRSGNSCQAIQLF